MKYIVHRRFKSKAICGDVNLPAMTECELRGNILYLGEKELCVVTSENSHQYFARNDDGNGMLRGVLTQAIQKRLSVRKSQDDPDYQARWDKVWEDSACQPYKRADYEDMWFWNHDFFGADIETLRHIAEMIGINNKEVK